MSDEAERKAMEWLDECCKLSPSPRVEYARTLKALLSRPVVPDLCDHKAIDVLLGQLDAEGRYRGVSRDLISTILRIMREPPAPRTKEVEVWHIEFWNEGEPCVTVCADKVTAEGRALAIRGPWATCIRVTGPHKQTVPV